MVLIFSQAGKRDSEVAIERGLYRGDDRLCGGRVGLSKTQGCSTGVTPAWVGHDGISL